MGIFFQPSSKTSVEPILIFSNICNDCGPRLQDQAHIHKAL